MKLLFFVENLNVQTTSRKHLDIQRGKILRIYHLHNLFNLFSDHDFGENIREDEQNDSIQSSYKSFLINWIEYLSKNSLKITHISMDTRP